MTGRFIKKTVIAAGTWIVLACSASGGELTPGLAKAFASVSAYSTADTLVEVVVFLDDYEPKEAVYKVSQAAGLSRSERAWQVIDRLKSYRSPYKEQVLDYVMDQEGAVVKEHWIVPAITVSVPVSRLAGLADIDGIKLVVENVDLVFESPVKTTLDVSTLTTSVSTQLEILGVPELWKRGLRGKGALVCSFDTGVDGAHPALRTRWRGYTGSSADSAASWYDPVTQSTYPKLIPGSLSPSHGTHVMGIIVGWDSAGSKMYGVAPDAKWISAAVIDATGASILDGFEWAADPDGDPNTIDDVPDVINHSWGYLKNWNYDVGCINLFFDAIDNTEALGIVNIFAAGNTGQYGAGTIFNPANRANDSLDCFAVGNTDTTTNPKLNTTSSRGPSQCNGGTKPNVVSPGTAILSTYPSNTYSYLSGTSMAAPHVAGLVALLRQKNPNATVTQIKQAILTSANPFVWPVPNDSVGWGQVDCMAAINALPANPATVNLRLFEYVHGSITPGATITGTLRIVNTGTLSANNVIVTITGSHPSLTIYDGIAVIGTIAAGAVGTSADQFSVKVSDTVTVGSVISVPLTIVANGYSTGATLHFLVEPTSFESTATHNTGRVQFTLSNFGVMGMAPGSFIPLGGAGFVFDGGTNSFFEAGLMAANGPTTVVSGVHEYIWSYENDFKVAPGGNMQFISPGTLTEQQTYSVFTDSSSFSPIGLRFVQESFSDTAPDNDFVILRIYLDCGNYYCKCDEIFEHCF